MPTIGLDCQIILDGQGYWIDPQSFTMARPRVRRADLTKTAATQSSGYGAGVAERYLDLGPGKRQWVFIVQAFQVMLDYSGHTVSSIGQQYRDALHASYEKINSTLSFTDPAGHTWSVRFDHLQEVIANVRGQTDGQLQYHLHVTLVEA
jgi:hypothetical protein